ncbi:MAG: SDR family NAD(P)-dependent oxidoreductase [Solirubrobacteraceae bacterium]
MSEVTTDDVLRGRVALVTGAGRGIGRRLAVGLARMDAHVALLARSENELGEAVAEIQAGGGIATAVVTDVQDADRLRVGVERVRAELGAPVVLINNAAVVTPLGRTEALDPVAVAAAVAVNIVAPITLSATLIPGMTAAGWGRIVNVSSGIAASPASMPGMGIYAASKAALEAATLNLAAELDGSGITANVYRPGAVDTAMQQWIRDQPADRIGAALHDRFAAMHADGNLITPEQSARSLLDRITSSQTGQIWSVDDPPR